MSKVLHEPDVTKKELEQLTYIYKNLPEVERSQMIYGASLLYASEKAREKRLAQSERVVEKT